MILLYILGWLALLLIISVLVLCRPYTEQEDLQRVEWEEWERIKDHQA